ncbi:endonuclease/exonuclease/phosphatase family protein [Rhizosaccharibacter radicis]|uniref:Endonuclease/exonuclease/phosphatase family protein n=1 Tax=Rhizosaccharibacter radicis TaxID=2782605 RepID=A0ABT1VZ29_9PROT|nr:endonuclease/exonuclease/phosphatase family protein [Acetobacteraceae bacterium KSS12]
MPGARIGGRSVPRDPVAHEATHPGQGPAELTIVSWNLLRRVGASLEDVMRLIDRERPDLLLMQEATHEIDGLPERIGGHYARSPLPGRIHGVACWSPTPFRAEPAVHALQPGALVKRVCQIIELGPFAIANVHLSHGQMLNRRQLRLIAGLLPPQAAVLGDFNLVGPCMVPGFRDVGPRAPTHRMADMVPIRLDRCLARALECTEARVLPHRPSDHHPIQVRLRLAEEARPPRRRLFYR